MLPNSSPQTTQTLTIPTTTTAMVLEKKSLSHKRWYFGMLYRTANYNVVCIDAYIYHEPVPKLVHRSGTFVVKNQTSEQFITG